MENGHSYSLKASILAVTTITTYKSDICDGGFVFVCCRGVRHHFINEYLHIFTSNAKCCKHRNKQAVVQRGRHLDYRAVDRLAVCGSLSLLATDRLQFGSQRIKPIFPFKYIYLSS